MGVTTAVDIANLALARLGQDAITTLTDSHRDATVCNRVVTQNREYCLGLYSWVSITHREHMTRAGKVAVEGITAAAPPVVTCTGHLFVNGDLVTLEDVLGMTEVNDGMYIVASKTTATIALNNTDGVAYSGTLWTAYSSGGYVYHHGGDNWAYVYDLPSLCLRVLEVQSEDWGSGNHQWRQENDKLYCDVEYAALKYLKDETDVSLYEAHLVEFMAARMAWLISAKVTSDDTVLKNAYQDWVTVSMQARIQNAKNRQAIPAPKALWTSKG